MKTVIIIYACFSLGALFGYLLGAFFAANRQAEECADCLAARLLEKQDYPTT